MKSISILLMLLASACFIDGLNDQNEIDDFTHLQYQRKIHNYANQAVPDYIENTSASNQLNDTIAFLGRVLFYDKKLSANNTIACASCHKQEYAFGDTARVSLGLRQKPTRRHTMRLVNVKFGEATTLFWDERAATLEAQTSQPIKDHIEMGFSGTGGDPTFEDLINKLEEVEYYKGLFTDAFGDNQITETRIQAALAQFIRSIQSFDSKYDAGRAQVSNDDIPFPNFTKLENDGKQLFLRTKKQGGADCQNCHRAPIFDVDPGTSNNGVIGVANDPTAFDLMNTRSPNLRDLVRPNGSLNGPLMHDGSLTSLEAVIEHYNKIPLDPRNSSRLNSRLRNANRTKGQNLQLTQYQKDALIAFLKTLTGSAIYTDERWSTPFGVDGDLIHY